MRTTMFVVALAAIMGCGGGGVSREVGARCSGSRDCADRCLGPSNDYPEGFCSVTCANEGDCPSDTDCVDQEGGVCLFSCDSTADCDFLGPSWICREENLRSDPNQKVGVCLGN